MKKLNRVAIVGFPNVGKSTLFNRLLGRKESLVHSLPGMTRDQVSALCRIDETAFTLVDTGGIFDFESDPFSDLVKEKAWAASREADVLIFLLDGKRGLLPEERELYLSLKKLDKPMIVVVNKADSSGEEDKLGDFYRLGPDSLLFISAEHKRHLSELKQALLDTLPHNAEASVPEALKIALVGRINVGKSSIVNLLSGREDRIVSEIPGTTRDSADTVVLRNGKAFCLVDTAGIRKLSRTRDQREKAGIIKARKDIAEADVICQVLDTQDFPTRQDTAIAHLARNSGKPLMLALNKWDLIEKQPRIAEACRAQVNRKLDFVSYAPLLFISALSGQRVVKILETAEEVYVSARRRIPTARLNAFLARVTSEFPPLSRSKGRIKFKYMTQAPISPPTFLLFTHSKGELTPAYERYFIGRIREEMDFRGSPIRLRLRRN